MLLLLTLLLAPGAVPAKEMVGPTGPPADGALIVFGSTPIGAMASVGSGLLVGHGPRLVYIDARGVKSTVHTFEAAIVLLATDGCRAFVVLERARSLEVVPLGTSAGTDACAGAVRATWPAPGSGPLAVPADPGSLHVAPKTGRVWLGAHAGIVVWGPDGKATGLGRIPLPGQRSPGWVVDIDLTPAGAVALVKGDDSRWRVEVRPDGALGKVVEIDPTAEHLDGDLIGIAALEGGRALVTTTAAAHIVEADGRVAHTLVPPAHVQNGPDAMIPMAIARPGATHLGAGWTVDTLDQSRLRHGQLVSSHRRTLPEADGRAWARHVVRWAGGLAVAWASDGLNGVTLYARAKR